MVLAVFSFALFSQRELVGACFVLNSFEFLQLSIQNHQFVPPIKKACMEVILCSSRSFIHTYVVPIIQSSNQREHWCLIIDNFICHYFPGFCLLLLVSLLLILFFNILFLLVFQTIELGCFYGINNVFIIVFIF
jgi:hypothetical protein